MAKERDLSRRERQIMDFLFRVGRATAAEVLEGLHDAPSYSAVRALLRILEQKGHIRHEEEGRAYVYMPLQKRDSARQSAQRESAGGFELQRLQYLLH